MKKITIAIDGPAGSGKTTTAKIVAEKLGFVYIDTGAMYRAVTLAWLEEGLTDMEHGTMNKLMDNISIELKASADGQLTIMNGRDVSSDIRSPEVTGKVSPVSAVACVRERLVAMQRQLGQSGGVVMDGRDIGTVVFPDAELKIFLVASVNERAKRRTREMQEKGMEADSEDIKRQISERDYYDSNREISPLRKADDAVEIDTSGLTIEQQSGKILELAADLNL